MAGLGSPYSQGDTVCGSIHGSGSVSCPWGTHRGRSLTTGDITAHRGHLHPQGMVTTHGGWLPPTGDGHCPQRTVITHRGHLCPQGTVTAHRGQSLPTGMVTAHRGHLHPQGTVTAHRGWSPPTGDGHHPRGTSPPSAVGLSPRSVVSQPLAGRLGSDYSFLLLRVEKRIQVSDSQTWTWTGCRGSEWSSRQASASSTSVGPARDGKGTVSQLSRE